MKWRSKQILAGLAPALVALLLYVRTVGFDFTNYDDNKYFYENPHVTQGLTLDNLRWAFEIHGPSMWVPLTWLSFQSSVELFGAGPAPQHLINTLLHAGNVFLLFLVIRRLTHRTPTALLVALLFAVHPVHVESIAWVTERKDVLCGFFWLLTLLFYDRYIRQNTWSSYLCVCVGTTLSVMAKPLAVTLPCVLLLLDFWPYRRPLSWRLAAEKAPLAVVVGIAAYLTMRCQLSIGAVGGTDIFPISSRVSNALMSYTAYIVNILWPTKLAVFYPYPQHINGWHTVACAAFLLSVTGLVAQQYRKAPWASVGWLWYIVTLLPMIGLVQAGSQAMADRYLYLPAIGIYLMIAMLCQTTRLRGLALTWIIVLCLYNVRQTGVWQNTRTLFAHALKVTELNYLAHNNYGLALRDGGDHKAACAHFRTSLSINPHFDEARNNLGITHAMLGDFGSAVTELQSVIVNNPANTDAIYNLGTVFLNAGQPNVSEYWLRQALVQNPQNAGIHYNLGYALLLQKRWQEAHQEFGMTLKLDPGHSGAATNFKISTHQHARAWELYESGNLLRQQGKLGSACEAYRQALEIRPNFPEAHNNFGVALGQAGDQKQALTHFEAALSLAPDYSDARINASRARQFTTTSAPP